MELRRANSLQFSPGDQHGVGRVASTPKMSSCLIGPDLSGKAGNPPTGAGLGEWAGLALWSQGSLWLVPGSRSHGEEGAGFIPSTVFTAIGLPGILPHL